MAVDRNRVEYSASDIRPLRRRAELHVVRDGSGWTVRMPRKSGARVFPTQAAAVKAAKIMVSDKGGQIVVHGSDGRVRGVDTYGRDERTIKDPPRRGRLSASEVRDAVWNATKGLPPD